MEKTHLIFIHPLWGGIAIVFVFFYLYRKYRRPCIALWLGAWSVMLLRYVAFDMDLWHWKESGFATVLFHLSMAAATVLFLLGAYSLIGRKIKKIIVACLLAAPFINGVLTAGTDSAIVRTTGPILLFCGATVWTGVVLLRDPAANFGQKLAGYAFVAWGVSSLTMPLVLSVREYGAAGYLVGCELRLLIALGTLFSFSEKNRMGFIHTERMYRTFSKHMARYEATLVPKFRIKRIDRTFVTMFGYSIAGMDLKLLLERVYPSDRDMIACFFKSLPRNGTDLAHIRIRGLSGEYAWIALDAVAIFDVAGILTGVRGSICDITEQKCLEVEAARLERLHLADSMAANIADEIQNPMRDVRESLQLLSGRALYKPDVGKFRTMTNELRRANAILTDYFAPQTQSGVSRCALNPVVADEVSLIEAGAACRNVHISVDLGDVPEVAADANELRQILLNLLRNAVEAMENGGVIRIETRCLGDAVRLSVQDQGPGIPAEVMEKLGTHYITTKKNGTGLGLATCFALAEKNGAKIEVATSETGTAFTILLKKTET